MNEKKGITVYCASSTHIDEKYFIAARRLGALIAESGYATINGGGARGLMGAVTDGALAAGGTAIGVIPAFMVDAGFCHPNLSETIVTEDMHSRKRTMAELAVGAIAMPGGVGTFEELMEMLTWRKLHLFDGPVVILNLDGYYDPMLQMLRRSVELGFSNPKDAERWLVASTPEEALEMVLNFRK